MWVFFDGTDQVTARFPKGGFDSQVIGMRPFKDNEKYMRELGDSGVYGSTFMNSGFDAVTQSAIEVDRIREIRNSKLSCCDYIMLSDVPVDSGIKESYVQYRAELRGLPSSLTSFSAIKAMEWPVEPSM